MNTSADPRQVEKLRAEYLDLLKIMYGSCLTGCKRAMAYSSVSFFGMLITQGALLGAMYLVNELSDRAIVNPGDCRWSSPLVVS
jgi:NADH:ubiquinone oxidoreductase subunit 4 (subunit M)